jgi:FkbM family methyltransferase
MRITRRTYAGGLLFAAMAVIAFLLVTQWTALSLASRCMSSGHLLKCLKDEPFDFEVDLFGMRYHGNTGDYIDHHIFYLGAYEKPVLFFMRDVMASIRPDGKGVFVDVGANTGQHSLFMSRFVRVVHAFEPYPPVLKRFRKLVKVNKISNIDVHPVGLGAKNETLRFFDPPETNHGVGTFVQSDRGQESKVRELKVVAGDTYLSDRKLANVDLIKIDIEGYEKPALTGLRRTLETSRPVVVLEVIRHQDHPASFKNLEEVPTVFPRGYKILLIDQVNSDRFTGAYLVREIPDGLSLSSSPIMFVLFPREKADQIPRRPRSSSN